MRAISKKSEPNQDNLKMNVLASIVLHKIFVKRGDSVKRRVDLTYNEKS